MAGATRAEIRQRVRDILAACTTLTMGSDLTAGGTLSTYPAYEVILTGASRQIAQGRGRNNLTLGVRVLVYTQAIDAANIDDERVVFPAIAAAEAQIDLVADWLTAHPTLRLSAAKPDLGEMLPISDNNAGLLDYRKDVFAGFILEFNVFIRH